MTATAADGSVLYVAGWGRSGSTLLAHLLSSVPGIVALGEVRSLWDRGMLEGRPCSCGQPADACPLWSEVIRRSGITRAEAEEARALHRRLRTRYFPRLAVRRLLGRRDPAMERYVACYRRVYAAAFEVTGARALVDISKHPFEADRLCRSPDVRAVHLVRDPRAVAFSWGRTKATGEDPAGAGDAEETMRRFGPLAASAMWLVWNLAVEILLGRRLHRVRYEDVVAAPERVVSEIVDRAAPAGGGDQSQAGPVGIAGQHLLAGNPDRFRGMRPVQADVEWASGMSSADARLATLPALPLLARYGYPLAPGRARRRGWSG